VELPVVWAAARQTIAFTTDYGPSTMYCHNFSGENIASLLAEYEQIAN